MFQIKLTFDKHYQVCSILKRFIGKVVIRLTRTFSKNVNHTFFTTCRNISNITGRTRTICTMVVNGTFCWFDARVVSGTRIYTLGVDTRFIAWAVSVRTTASYYTSNLWISYPSRRTFTYSLVIDSITFSVGATAATI